MCTFFFFNDTATTEIYTLSLHDALPIWKYFRQRLEQLAQSPAKLLAAETERDRGLEESRRASAGAGELRAQVEERDRASAELVGARRRASDLERRLTARPAGYDPARHDAVRAELAKLEPVALEAAALEERARRAERLVPEAEHAAHQTSGGGGPGGGRT